MHQVRSALARVRQSAKSATKLSQSEGRSDPLQKLRQPVGTVGHRFQRRPQSRCRLLRQAGAAERVHQAVQIERFGIQERRVEAFEIQIPERSRQIPDADALEPITITHETATNIGNGTNGNGDAAFAPYLRADDTLSRPWAVPGNPGTEHRLGGLEKANTTGNVSYDPDNHQLMTALRAEKVARVADLIPPTEVFGDTAGGDGSLLLLGWGGTYGSIHTAVRRAVEQGRPVAQVHLRHLNPMPRDLGDIVKRYDKVLIPELNTGQLRPLIRGKFLIDAKGLNKIHGKPFLVEELTQAIDLMLSNNWPTETEAIMPRHGQVNPAGAQYAFS